MTRPTYETDVNTRTEQEIAEVLGQVWGVSVIKRPGKPILDFEVRDGDKVLAYLELKDRRPNYSVSIMRGLGSVMISSSKMAAGARAVRKGHCFMLVVVLSDGLLCWSSKWHDDFPDFKIRMGGRNDRGDPADWEPCVHIPFNLFKVIQWP